MVDIHPQALGALHAEAHRVRARQRGVVLQQDGFAVLTGQRGGHDVAQLELDPGAGVGGAAALGHGVFVQAARLGRERIDVGEAVAAVDAGVHRARADAVAGVQLTVALDRMLGAPARFAPALGAELHAAVVGLVRIAGVELHAAQVVLVAGLQMHQLAEQALAHHLQCGHHVTAVADVLQQHVRGAG
ncbi:hypothetical protein G6F23_013660 [Rhizopus arrhizus]|nr:hypothetical protein G6F23_013660 [Rhizopus arrhizus]